MSKEQPNDSTMDNLVDGILAGIRMTHVDDKSERIVTQLLENNVRILEGQRERLIKSNLAHIPDVREHGSYTADLLIGFDEQVTLDDLHQAIKHMRSGLAQRRVLLGH